MLGFPLVRFLPLLNNFLFVCHKFVSEPFIRPPTLHRIGLILRKIQLWFISKGYFFEQVTLYLEMPAWKWQRSVAARTECKMASWNQGENKLLQSGNAETKFLPMKTNSSKIICCPQMLKSVTFAFSAAYNKSGSQCFKNCTILLKVQQILCIESLHFIEFFKPFNELFDKSL